VTAASDWRIIGPVGSSRPWLSRPGQPAWMRIDADGHGAFGVVQANMGFSNGRNITISRCRASSISGRCPF
jgi:hypothetical protein